MDKQIDTIKVRIADRPVLEVEVNERYEPDEDCTVIMRGAIIQETASSNNDGSVSLMSKFKPTDIEVIKNNKV